MKEVLDIALQEYLRSLLPEYTELQKEMMRYAQENHIPIVEPEVGQLLGMLTSISKAQNILEIGTAIGYSTICMASNLPKNGKLKTIELVEERAQQAARYFSAASLSDKIEQIIGDAREIIPRLNGRFDLIFVDAAKGQYQTFFPYFDQLLNPGGLLIADNVLLNGWVVNLDYPNHRKKTFVYRMREFLAEMQRNTSYQSSIIPLGDGVAIMRKKENHEYT